MTAEELDRIKRAEEIQRYTENRCEALEKENAELKKDLKSKDLALEDFVKWSDKQKKKSDKQLLEAKEIIKKFLNAKSIEDTCVVESEAERFLKELEVHEERLCAYCDQYKSCPDGKRCHTCDNGSKWRRNK